jgi:hypothetical protein
MLLLLLLEIYTIDRRIILPARSTKHVSGRSRANSC